jgi:hypothetical protein
MYSTKELRCSHATITLLVILLVNDQRICELQFKMFKHATCSHSISVDYHTNCVYRICPHARCCVGDSRSSGMHVTADLAHISRQTVQINGVWKAESWRGTFFPTRARLDSVCDVFDGCCSDGHRGMPEKGRCLRQGRIQVPRPSFAF